MTIIKAIEHFKFKFKNTWRATGKDHEALKEVIDFVNDKHKQQLQDNQMFAKVYIFMYAYFIKHYNTDIYDDIPQKELHKYLDKPLETIIDRFKDVLNEKAIETMYKEKGIKIQHPATQTQKEKDEDLKKLSLEDFNDAWDYNTVADTLETMINLALNQYK